MFPYCSCCFVLTESAFMRASVAVAGVFVCCMLAMPNGVSALASLAGGILLLSPAFVLVALLIAFSRRTSKSAAGQPPYGVTRATGVSQYVNTTVPPRDVYGWPHAPVWPVVSTGLVGPWTPPARTVDSTPAGLTALHQRRYPSGALQQRINSHRGGF